MRTIEEKIIETVRARESKKLSCRDSVTVDSDSTIKVQLWNNCIFTVTKENVITFSLCGWQTNTTKGRIKALLKAFSSCNAKIIQKNGSLVFTSDAGEFPIDSNRVYIVVDGRPEAKTDL